MSDDPYADDPPDHDRATIEAYKERFGDTPNLIWVEDQMDEAIKLLELALETDEGYEGNEFYELLGVDPPPDRDPV